VAPSPAERGWSQIVRDKLFEVWTEVPGSYAFNERFWVETTTLPGHTIIGVGGALDLATAEEFAIAVRRAFAVPDRAIVIDLTSLEFISAAGIHIIDEARVLSTITMQPLRMVADDRRLVVRMLRAAGLTGSLVLFPALEDALKAGAETRGEIVSFGH
jgi:anti-anti-sigma factor